MRTKTNHFRGAIFAAAILCSVILSSVASAQLTGTKNIPGDYADLTTAISALNTQGVGAGGVTLNVVAGNPQTAPSGGYVIGGTGSLVLTTTSSSNQVTIQGNNNTITASAAQTAGSVTDAIFKLIGADWITITACTMQENVANTVTTLASNNMTEFGVALFYVTTTDGAQNNTIKNNTISLNRSNLNTFGVYSNTRTTAAAPATLAEATAATGSNSNNKIYGNAISNVNYGVVFIGAGTTIAAIDTGNDIGGTSATTGNTITNWGGGSSTGGYLSLTSSNYCIFDNQQINDNVSFNTITSATLTNAVTTGGLLKNYSVAQPTGTITTTINNNTVTVTNNPSSSTAGAIIGLNNQGLTPLLSTATMSMNNNTVQNCVLGGATSTTNGITGITNLSLPGTMNMTGNSVLSNSITATTETTGALVAISNSGAAGTVNMTTNSVVGNSIAASSATSALLVGITNSGAAGTVNMNNNVVRSHASTAASGQPQGITNSGAVVTALNINSNALGNATSGFFSSSIASSGTLFGISASTMASTCAVTIQNNDIRGITYSVAATAGQSYVVDNVTTASENISGNTFTNLNVNTTGAVTMLSASNSTTNVTINNNSIVTGFTRNLSSTNLFYGIYNFGSPGSGTLTVSNNNFSNITLNTTSSTLYGIYWATSTGPTQNVFSNTVSNFSNPAAGTLVGMTLQYGTTNNLYSNTVSGLSNGGAVTGILAGNSSSVTMNVYSNTINTLSTTGGALVTGLNCAASGTSAVLTGYKNKIYDLSGSNASSTVNGISITAGVTTTLYNNLVGDLRAPAANAANAIIGINAGAGTTDNIYYNTVYLTGTSTGPLFGSSAIFASTTPTVTLRNNIFANNNTPVGTTGFAVAYRRSTTTLTSYGSASNNNDFYAGSPSAANLLYYDGTNSDQTLAAYKTRVSPRDANSVSENPPFLSTTGSSATFLHINPSVATQLESGGAAISGITDDFDGDTRNLTTPDIGADEFTGTPSDMTPPTISYTPLSGTASMANRTLTVTITDPSGVATGGLAPRIYFKKSTDANYVSTQCTGSSPTYTCTIDNSLVGGGVTTGETIQYFVVAQDTAGNVGANPSGGFAATSVNNVTSPPTTPNSYSILTGISGNKNVGAGGDYATVTAAVSALNNSEITSPVTLTLTDASYTGETLPITINVNNGSSATNTVTIKPASGVSPTISGASASCVINLNGADYVIIDGSNTVGGTTRDLTITNTSTAATTAVVCMTSLGAGQGATFDTVKNTNLATGSSSVATYGVSIGTTVGVGGPDNDNDTVQNNAITVASTGIYAIGTASVSAGGDDNLSIIGNSITSSTSVATLGIRVGNSLSSSISQNTISVQTSLGDQPVGISLETGFVSSTVTRNNITKALTTATGGYGGRGITVGTGTTTSNLTIANNFVSGVNGSNYSAFGNSSSMGIGLGVVGNSGTLTTTTGGVNLYFNSVNMYGAGGYSSATITAALYVGSGATALDVRDNIFVNSITNPTTPAGTKSYAIYSAGTSAAFTNIDYNDYYVAGAGTQGVLGFITSDRADLTAIQAGFGGNIHSVSGDPQFTSASDLHINPTVATVVSNAGVTIAGITNDYDGDTRNNPPDIGADEGNFVTPVTNDMQATAFIDPTNGGSKPAGVAFSPQASFTNNGTATQSNVPVRYRICTDSTCTSEVYNNTATIASIASGVTTTVTFAPTTLSAGTYTIKARSELVGDQVAANDEITGSLTVRAPLNGTYTIGATAASYPTITAAIADLNGAGVAGPVTFSLIDSSYSGSETFPLTINAISGASATNTITFKPAGGVSPTISGSNATAIFDLNGAKFVVIDGSKTAGGTTKDLTISNTNTGGVAIRLINGASNNTVKNALLKGVGTTAGTGVVFFSTGSIANSNNTIQNNTITGGATAALNGVYMLATSSTNGSGNVISGNTVNDFSQAGVYIDNYYANTTVTGNTIFEVTTQTSTAIYGIYLNYGPTATTISQNTIRDLRTSGASSTLRGIYFANGTSGDVANITNNMITLNATITIADATIYGIDNFANGGTIANIYFNSVRIGGSGVTAGSSAGLYYHYSHTDNSKDNIVVNARSNSTGAGKHYGIQLGSTTPTLTSDYNDIIATGTGGVFGNNGTSDYATLAAWRTGTSKDGNSISSDPLFISTTDLHIRSGLSPVIGAGTPLAGITIDFDNDPRSATAPAIGADEVNVLANWKRQYFNAAQLADPNVSGDAADPDGDGLNNYQEFAFGTDPTVNNPSLINGGGVSFAAPSTVTAGRPTTYVQQPNPLAQPPVPFAYLAVFSRRDDYATIGLTYTVQFSSDATTYTSSTVTPTVQADNGTVQAVTVPYPYFINGQKARFFQVMVTPP